MSSAWLCLFICVCAAPLVQAAPITFFGEDLNGNPSARIIFPNAVAARASFIAQAPNDGTDTLEEFGAGTLVPLTLGFSGKATAMVNAANGSIQNVSSGTDFFGRFPTSGNNFLLTDAAALSLAFTSPITSFGFYGTDIGDFGGVLSLQFTLVGGATRTVTVPHSLGTGTGSPQDGSVLFFGYIDTAAPFTAVQFLDSASSDSFGLDDPIAGAVAQVATVPEPSSLAFLGIGISGMLLRLRKKRTGGSK